MRLFILMWVLLWLAFVGLTYVWTQPPEKEVVAERPPIMYCQISAGNGVAVYTVVDIGNGNILTDEKHVFHESMCREWSDYAK